MSLSKFLKEKEKQIIHYIQKDAPRIVAKMALDSAKQTFVDEGFTDNSFLKWDEVQRRQNVAKKDKKKAGSNRKILTQSGDLRKSIHAEVKGMAIEIGSDLDYAQAHNEGTDTAGRNRKVKIPKRQFLGKSAKLETALKAKFEHDLTIILT